MSRSGRLKPCFWCRQNFRHRDLTVDHLIPEWALNTIPGLRPPLGPIIVKACQKCNTMKAGMPPAVFASVREYPKHCKNERIRWQTISSKMMSSSLLAPEMIDLCRDVIAEMREPLPPPYSWPRTPDRRVWTEADERYFANPME